VDTAVLPTGAGMKCIGDLYANRLLHICSLDILNKRKKRVRFGDVLYPSQRDAVWSFENHRRIAVVKGRQLGFTTVLNADRYCELATSCNGLHHGLFAVKRVAAEKLLQMMRTFHKGVPEKYRRTASHTRSTFEFGITGAKAEAFSALTYDSDRGATLSSAHLSEFAYYPDGMEMLASLTSSVNDGLVVLESTPNHWGDPLHQVIQGAQYGDGEAPWHVLFIPWWHFPEYRKRFTHKVRFTDAELAFQVRHRLDREQLYWRRMRIREMGDPILFRREYPPTIDAAYGDVDGAYFSAEQLGVFTNVLRVSPGVELQKWQEPEVGNPVVFGVDVAEGVGLDYSVAYGVDRAALRPVMTLSSNRMGIRAFAEAVATQASKYNARIVVELNNHGHAFKAVLDGLGFTNYEAFKTSVKSKLKLYDVLRTHVDEGLVDTIDDLTLNELKQLQRSERGLAPKHPDGLQFHDDRVMSYSLALWGLRHMRVSGGLADDLFGSTKDKTSTRNPRRNRSWN